MGLLLWLWLRAPAAFGQTAPHGYDFLTVLTVESADKSVAKVLITPAFQNKSEIQLVDVTPHYATSKRVADIAKNTLTINQLLGDLTAAGWEFLQVYPLPPVSGAGLNPVASRYLFRKPRP
ncbi:MAG: hypothetical protein ACRYG7_34030 [Janthinobacterium lividum]